MSFTFDQLQQLLENAGMDSAGAATGAAVALAESGGDPNAVGDNGTSFGLWQIHLPAHPDVSQACASDPACGAAAAVRISSNGSDWSPWSTFTSGAYQQFLGAQQAVEQVGQKLQTPWFGGGVTGVITQVFGVLETVFGINAPHTGIDVAAPAGTPVVAAAGATVVDVQHLTTGFGNSVTIKLADGSKVLFGHLQDTAVTTGQVLNPGDLIGHVGSTGLATGSHLHFQVWDAFGHLADPFKLLTGKGLPKVSLPNQVPGVQAIADAIGNFGQLLLYALLGLALVWLGLLLLIVGSVPWGRLGSAAAQATPEGRIATAAGGAA